ncbi:hypothetical protein RCH06_003442 [Polaromonas sp. CG_9.5]|nr:hypothetical protein [Polaromonas sp. CG_9.5]
MTKGASVSKIVVLVLAFIGLVAIFGLVGMGFRHFSMMDWMDMR